MKFHTVALSALATATTMTSAQPPPPDCTNTGDLLKLAQGENGNKCSSATGLTLVPPTAPTAEQITKICGNNECKSLLAALNAAVPNECKVVNIKLREVILDPVTKICGGSNNVTKANDTITTPSPTIVILRSGSGSRSSSVITAASAMNDTMSTASSGIKDAMSKASSAMNDAASKASSALNDAASKASSLAGAATRSPAPTASSATTAMAAGAATIVSIALAAML